MENLIQAALYAKTTFMIAPLIVFCFIPVWQDAKSPPTRLFLKVIASFAGMEILMFLVYLLLPLGMADNLNMLLCIVVFFYLYQREIALERSHLWFIFMTACTIGSFSFLFYHLIDIFLHPVAVIEEPVHSDSFLFQIAFEVFLIALLFYPARKHLGWLVHHFHEEKIWRVIWLLPFGFMIFSLTFIPYDNSIMYFGFGRFLDVYTITIFVLFVLVFIVYTLFYKIAYSMIENRKTIERTANLEIQAQQYHKLQIHMQETSRLRHDFRYQLTVLAQMLRNQHYKETEDYLEQYISSVPDTLVRYCASSAVNAILNHYGSICRELGIAMQWNIRLLETFSVEDVDFCVLLGNLLENAIDGCKALPEENRQIILKVGQTAEHVMVLQISNPYENFVSVKNGKFFSSKHKGQGQGIQSVQLIAEEYNGFVDIHYENQMFEVKVLLNF